METTAKQAFAARLVEAMRQQGYRSARNARSGVDVVPLANAAQATREMARRYTEGTAIPGADKMARIAKWLDVRVAWLRDAEGPMRAEVQVQLEPGAVSARQPIAVYESVDRDALEIARAWSKLSPEMRAATREILFTLALTESRSPWLRRGRPKSETYDEWEKHQVDDMARRVRARTKA